jgi:hypothetical protein
MSSDDPKTLLIHPAKAEGNRGRARPRSIENMLRFAALKLRESGTVERRDKDTARLQSSARWRNFRPSAARSTSAS